MALGLWNPYSNFYMDAPVRDPWGLFEPEPLDFWPESNLLAPFGISKRGLRPYGIGSPALERSLQQHRREVVSNKDKYQITLDLDEFKTNEISVKVVDNCLVICAEHEEKEDDHGHVYRHIKRRFVLPRNVDQDKLNATLSDKGALVVCAPKKPKETGNERNIEIKQVKEQPEPMSVSESEEAPKKTEQIQANKGKNIPVSHETTKK